MANASNESTISSINTTIDLATELEKDKFLMQLKKLCTKESNRKITTEILVNRLGKVEQSGATRSLLQTALVEVDSKAAVKVLSRNITDPSERLRYQSATLLAALKEKDAVEVTKQLKHATKDESPRVRATALRLLLEGDAENGDTKERDSYKKQLLDMLTNGLTYEKWSVFKALRSEAGNEALPRELEKVFVDELIQTLGDDSEWRDVRYQAAAALGDVKHLKDEAVSALCEAVRKNPSKSILMNCIDSLQGLGQAESQQALLTALKDNDIEICIRAAEALKKILGKKEAITLITDDLVRQDQTSDGLVHALRHIDSSMASEILSSELLNPDPNAAKRAENALTQLGGIHAIRVLQVQREKALETYTTLLGDADKIIMVQFDNLMSQASFAFRMSMGMHLTIFAIGVVILLVSVYAALDGSADEFHRFLGVGGATGSLATLLFLFYKDPIKNISHSVTNLVKVNIVFLGYVRQINQIDATFKQLFISMNNFGTDQMKETVEQIQISVNKTLAKVKSHLIEKEEDNKETVTDN